VASLPVDLRRTRVALALALWGSLLGAVALGMWLGLRGWA